MVAISRGHSEVILLVEDDSGIRKLVAAMLAGHGYLVIVADVGRSALTILEEGCAVNLLLTDITMPNGMSGFEVAVNARRLEPGLKVLYMSGYMKDSVLSLQQASQKIDLLPKPFGVKELAHAVCAALSQVPAEQC